MHNDKDKLYDRQKCIKIRVDMIFYFNDTATTEIYTLSLHDALPIWMKRVDVVEIQEGNQFEQGIICISPLIPH